MERDIQRVFDWHAAHRPCLGALGPGSLAMDTRICALRRVGRIRDDNAFLTAGEGAHGRVGAAFKRKHLAFSVERATSPPVPPVRCHCGATAVGVCEQGQACEHAKVRKHVFTRLLAEPRV